MGPDDAKGWRRELRKRLVAKRESLTEEERRGRDERITASLEQAFCPPPGTVVGLYWPYRGEFDARAAARRWRAAGALTALPEVVGSNQPLRFRKWWPGAPMVRGVYDIPVPDETPILEPDALIVPMNGFDARGFRLGYGGGFFDRTLASLKPRPLAVGVSFEMLRIDTIHPEPHDIPMDFIVTESSVYKVGGNDLAPVAVEEAAALMRDVLNERGLPRAASQSPAEYASPPCYAHEFPEYFGHKPEE